MKEVGGHKKVLAYFLVLQAKKVNVLVISTLEKLRDKYIQLPPLYIPCSYLETLHGSSLLTPLLLKRTLSADLSDIKSGSIGIIPY